VQWLFTGDLFQLPGRWSLCRELLMVLSGGRQGGFEHRHHGKCGIAMIREARFEVRLDGAWRFGFTTDESGSDALSPM
jgi:hypothetical protein